MYVLKFRQYKSKSFESAMQIARQFNTRQEGEYIVVEISDVINAYPIIRKLFGYVQNRKGTSATYYGKTVKPYIFVLSAFQIGKCGNTRKNPNHCGTGWKCGYINRISYNHNPNSTSNWYNHGNWQGNKWIIDKKKIKALLLQEAEDNAVIDCPFFNRLQLLTMVDELPDYLVEGAGWEKVYKEKFVGDTVINIPINIKKEPANVGAGSFPCLTNK